ncbi:MAG TPA: glycosyltransferase [Gammaproteobacteria bacterium]|nr:glycosyltransferase [Gammaproteobacteria bacterium]
MRYVVLGMHRSGTSMVARLLNMMGASFGDADGLRAPAKDNERGFWERREVIAINDRILRAAGSSWDDVHCMDFARVPDVERAGIDAQISDVVSRLDVQRPWVIKDPRLCLTLSWWLRHIPSPVFVVPVRDPLEVASSLARRNRMPMAVGISLWEFYIRSALRAIRQSRDGRTIVLDYNVMLSEPHAGMDGLHASLVALGTTALRRPTEQEISAFVAVDLNHNRDVGGNAIPTAHLRRVQRLYRSLAGAHLEAPPAISGSSSAAARGFLEVQHQVAEGRREIAVITSRIRAAESKVAALQERTPDAQVGGQGPQGIGGRDAASKIATSDKNQQVLLQQLRRVLRDELGVKPPKAGYTNSRNFAEVVAAEVAALREANARARADLREQLREDLAIALAAQESTRLRETRARLRELQATVRRTRMLHDAVFQSVRWRLGNAVCRIVEIATFRGRVPLAADELSAIYAEMQRCDEPVIDEVSEPQAPADGVRLTVLATEGAGGRRPNVAVVAASRALAAMKWSVHGLISLLPMSRVHKEALRQQIFELQEAILLRRPSAAVLEDTRVLASRRDESMDTAGARAERISIDLSLVLYKSQQHIDGFVQGLRELDYPLGCVQLHVTDHSPDGQCAARFEQAIGELRDRFAGVEFHTLPNRGFGAGHNSNLLRARHEIFLVCNVDGHLTRHSISNLARAIARSRSDVAAWEMRQAPYEHPKYYDPVTLETSWVSGACTAFRTSVLQEVKGFEPKIFMYGEDVELSYRLRAARLRLCYVPSAVFHHETYASPGEFKPLQFGGSTLANAYIRLRYGRTADIVSVPGMWLQLASAAAKRKEFRRYLRNTLSLLRHAPYFLLTRRRGVDVPFAGWDYGLRRDGAFVRIAAEATVGDGGEPRASIIVRTYGQRHSLLRQALLSLANQSYRNLEAIVVEDGGSAAAAVCDDIGNRTGLRVKHLALAKVGRCVAGNAGLAASTGAFVGFLDDDDLLFADHVELLASTLTKRQDLSAAYALAWECAAQVDDKGCRREVMHRTVPLHRQSFSRSLLEKYNLMPIQAVLFRRSLYELYGGLDPDLEILEDWDLWRRYSYEHDFLLLEKTTSIYHVPADPQELAQRQVLLDRYYEVAKGKFEVFKASCRDARVGAAVLAP